ncbi:hypothetical protein O181_014660 [Austropuccinia psidii MF-1]|uniref:Cyclopropane-fatty-acyl-phospholipid synthase n=1 Tax=Austropuccinia psidii MF-1 TaxID=1389203 RepID=A0A9Q3C2A6_9BASI|nr:hypothetical protein [Austropuccinia psidii MF-1]
MDDSQNFFKTKNFIKSSNPSLNLISKYFNRFTNTLIDQSWTPLVLIAQTTIISLMQKITQGKLRVLTQSGIYQFPAQKLSKSRVQDSDELSAEIRVINNAFWVRMFLFSDLGFAEAYMVGDIQVDDLNSIFKLFIFNRSSLSELSMINSSLFSTLNLLMNSRFVNSISNSISNISAHYDISNEMFKAFLSQDMTYSCAYFTPKLGGPGGDLNQNLISLSNHQNLDPLELAQYEKLDLIIHKAKIRKNDRVLELGSGWGSFAIRAVQSTGCQVDTITLSVEQKALAQKRIQELGLQDSIRVHLLDYRNLPTKFEGAFDRVVSIEMIEAVGLEFLENYFSIVNKCLNSKSGIGVFQVITIPEARFERYIKQVDFIRKWIFPGGILPTVTYMVDSIAKGSKNQLTIESIENIGTHYARTLREWQKRFESNFDSIIAPSLSQQYPEVKQNPQQIETFRRKWVYYFSYCSTGFECRVLGDHIFTITREGNLFYHYKVIQSTYDGPQ